MKKLIRKTAETENSAQQVRRPAESLQFSLDLERSERHPLSVSAIPSVETRISTGKDKKRSCKNGEDPSAPGNSLVRVLIRKSRDDGEDLPGAGPGNRQTGRVRLRDRGRNLWYRDRKRSRKFVLVSQRSPQDAVDDELLLDFPYGMYYNFY